MSGLAAKLSANPNAAPPRAHSPYIDRVPRKLIIERPAATSAMAKAACRAGCLAGTKCASGAAAKASPRTSRRSHASASRAGGNLCLAKERRRRIGAYPSMKSKRIEKDDILDYFGEPDQVVDRSQAMHYRVWKCDACDAVTHSDVPIRPPAPCRKCGNISFEAISDA